MQKVIGVGGQKLNGKTTIAKHLIVKLAETDRIFFRKRAFADKVKDIFCDTFGVDRDFIEYWKPRDEVPPGFDVTVRKALQIIGDEFRKIKGNVWIEYLFKGENKTDMVIDDCRYINELRRVREAGGFNILVYRSGFLNDDPNGSESQIRPIVEWFLKFSNEGVVDMAATCANVNFLTMPAGVQYVDIFLLNNGTPEELHTKIDNIVIPYITDRYATNPS